MGVIASPSDAYMAMLQQARTNAQSQPPSSTPQPTTPTPTTPASVIPAYEQDASGNFVYNPDNTAGIPNDKNLPVNTSGSKYAPSSDGSLPSGTTISPPTPEQAKEVIEGMKEGKSPLEIAKEQGRVHVPEEPESAPESEVPPFDPFTPSTHPEEPEPKPESEAPAPPSLPGQEVPDVPKPGEGAPGVPGVPPGVVDVPSAPAPSDLPTTVPEGINIPQSTWENLSDERKQYYLDMKARTDWLSEHGPPPDPTLAPRQYVEWIENNPHATPAQKAQAALIKKFNYSLPPNLTQAHIEQAFTPSLKELGELREEYADNPEIAEMSDEELRQYFRTQKMEIAGVKYVKRFLDGVDAEGKPIKVDVTPEEYWNVMNQTPQERLDDLMKLGVLPEGTELITDVPAFNEKFGTNIPEDQPYATPDLVTQVNEIVRREGGARILVDQGLAHYNDKGELVVSPEAFKEAMDNETIRDSLLGVGYTEEEITLVEREIKATIEVFEQQLEDMPEEAQRAYEEGGLEAFDEWYANYLKDFEGKLKGMPDELRQAYEEGGFEGYNAKVEELRKQAESDFVDVLKDYPDEVQKRAIEILYSQGLEKAVDYLNREYEWLKEKAETQEAAREAALQQLASEGFKSTGMGGPDGLRPVDIYDYVGYATEHKDDPEKVRELLEAVGFDYFEAKAIAALGKYEGNAPLAVADGAMSAEDLERVGFAPEDIEKILDTVKAAEETGVALPGEETWIDVSNPDVQYTTEEYEQLVADFEAKRDQLAIEGKMGSEEWYEMGGHPSNRFVLSSESGRRKMIEVTSMLFFSPTRALLPEVEIGDISGLEWGIGVAQLALWSTLAVPSAIVPVSAATAGVFGANLGVHWDELDTTGKVIGAVGVALAALPLTIAVAGKVAPTIGSVSIPLKGGRSVTVWKGVSVGGKPVIGISGGRAVIGTRGVRLPNIRGIKAGYQPVTKLETTLVGTRRALAKMGLTEAEIARVEATLKARGFFAGRQSPYLSKYADIGTIKALSREGVAEVFKASTLEEGLVSKVYGSYTIKSQLDPTLRGWRQVADLDIMTNLSADETALFARRLVARLERTEGKGNVRVNPEKPSLIETKGPDGRWHHAVDIHSYEITPGSQVANEGAWGMMHAEKAISVELPNIGKVKFMRLSESGKRKAASITEFQTAGAGKWGDIGPYPDDISAITQVSRGNKPLAIVENTPTNRAAARARGLRAIEDPQAGLIVHLDDAASLSKAQSLQKSFSAYWKRISEGVVDDVADLQSHVEIGEALGYTRRDIGTFLKQNYADDLIQDVAPDYFIEGIQPEARIGPQAHRVKDIGDFYVILRTYKGKAIADRWAKAFGYDPDELLAIASKDPPTFTWEMVPDNALSTPTGSPTVYVSVPANMTVQLSPGLSAAIAAGVPTSEVINSMVSVAAPTSEGVSMAVSRAITSRGLAPRVPSLGLVGPAGAALASPTAILSMRATDGSPAISSGSISDALEISPTPSVMASSSLAAAIASPIAAPSPGEMPSPPSVPSPEVPSIEAYSPPGETPSPGPPSPTAKTSPPPPSPAPSPSPPPPSPEPSPSPELVEEPSPTPSRSIIVPRGGPEDEEVWVDVPPGSIAWRQGAPFGKEQIKYIPPPYDAIKPYSLLGKKPVGWVDKGKSPKESLQIIGESEQAVPHIITIDLGVADIEVIDGKEIRFKGGGLMTDVGERVKGPTMGLGISALRGQGHKPEHYGTTFVEAMTYEAKDDAQREFIERDIARLVSEMDPDELVQQLKLLRQMDVPEERIQGVLEHVPDKERAHVETMLADEDYYVPVGRGQYAKVRQELGPKDKKGKKDKDKEKKERKAKGIVTAEELARMRAEQARALGETAEGRSKLRPYKQRSKTVKKEKDEATFYKQLIGMKDD